MIGRRNEIASEKGRGTVIDAIVFEMRKRKTVRRIVIVIIMIVIAMTGIIHGIATMVIIVNIPVIRVIRVTGATETVVGVETVTSTTASVHGMTAEALTNVVVAAHITRAATATSDGTVLQQQRTTKIHHMGHHLPKPPVLHLPHHQYYQLNDNTSLQVRRRRCRVLFPR